MANSKNFLTSSIGKKVTMAVTGLLLIGFIIGHLSGNLLMFAGQDKINDYAAFLQSIPGPLWVARIGLLVAFVLHVVTAAQLAREKRQARPEKYAYKNTVQASVASRSMGISGSFILLFVIGHLLHFTWGVIYPEYAHMTDAQGRHDVYNMVVMGFSQPIVTIPYLIALLLLGTHLSHAISSVFQTLGFNHPKYTPLIEKIGPALAVIITIGYIAIPLSVLVGIIS